MQEEGVFEGGHGRLVSSLEKFEAFFLQMILVYIAHLVMMDCCDATS